MLLPSSLQGPLGSHIGYLQHIALRNFLAYQALKNTHAALPLPSLATKYEELRLFLNTVESVNNVLDYFYFENELAILPKHSTVSAFRKAVHAKFDELQVLANLANAYKHCVRSGAKGAKNGKLPWAKDLQRPALSVTIDITDGVTPNVDVKYTFEWPIPEHDQALKSALDFWVQHLKASRADELTNA